MLRRSLLFSGLAAVHLQQQLQAKSVCAAEEQQQVCACASDCGNSVLCVALPQPHTIKHIVQVLRVGAGQQYTSVAAAVAAAPPGTTVLIDPGR